MTCPWTIQTEHVHVTNILFAVMQAGVSERLSLTQQFYMGQVMELWLSCYMVLLSIDSKTR